MTQSSWFQTATSDARKRHWWESPEPWERCSVCSALVALNSTHILSPQTSQCCSGGHRGITACTRSVDLVHLGATFIFVSMLERSTCKARNCTVMTDCSMSHLGTDVKSRPVLAMSVAFFSNIVLSFSRPFFFLKQPTGSVGSETITPRVNGMVETCCRYFLVKLHKDQRSRWPLSCHTTTTA